MRTKEASEHQKELFSDDSPMYPLPTPEQRCAAVPEEMRELAVATEKNRRHLFDVLQFAFRQGTIEQQDEADRLLREFDNLDWHELSDAMEVLGISAETSGLKKKDRLALLQVHTEWRKLHPKTEQPAAVSEQRQSDAGNRLRETMRQVFELTKTPGGREAWVELHKREMKREVED